MRPAFISPDIHEGKYLFLDLNPPRRAGLTLVGAGREVCAENYRIDRPGFEYHTVEFVVGGTWSLEHGGHSEVLRSGALFAYGPETGYSLVAGGGGELIKYFVNFTGGGAGECVEACGLSGCAVRYAHQPRWILDLFDQLIDGNRLDLADARQLGAGLLELILGRIRCDAWSGDENRSGGRQTFARCRGFIHDHYLEVGSVGEIAERCYLDPAYLARLFQRYANERPLQLLTRLKTQHAADLILRQGFTVAQAGEAVGFEDPYHFSRVFKRVHGVAPGSLRRKSG